MNTIEELLLALYGAATEVAEVEFAPFAGSLVQGLLASDDAARATTVELLAPHLAQATKINRALTGHSASVLRPSSAIARLNGDVQYAAPAFRELLQQEWPDWQDERLPAPLFTALRTGQPIAYHGRSIVVRGRMSFDFILLQGSARSPLLHLSAREKEAAMLFGAGKSTKEIARAMAVSHNSVRNFVQRAYKKLGVGDKAELAVLIGAWSAPA